MFSPPPAIFFFSSLQNNALSGKLNFTHQKRMTNGKTFTFQLCQTPNQLSKEHSTIRILRLRLFSSDIRLNQSIIKVCQLRSLSAHLELNRIVNELQFIFLIALRCLRLSIHLFHLGKLRNELFLFLK